MNFGTIFSSSSKLILLDDIGEEDDASMVKYSYLLHLTIISDNP